jgi:hypothetical protein
MNTDINQIAKQTRETLKKEFPNCTFSVTLHKYSGGRTMTIALMSANFEALKDETDAQLNRYTLTEGFDRRSGTQIVNNEWTEIPEGYALCNGALITRKAWEVLQRAAEVGNADNWDNSDSQTDYFDVNYYLDINIGKWNKPYEIAI